MAPGWLRRRRWQQRRLQHGSQIKVEVLLGDIRQAEFEADHLALFGGAEPPGHGTRWLRQDRRVSRAAATADGAAATVEQQQLHLLLAADIHQTLLRPVLRPRGGGGAGVLGRVRVADHHFLRALQTRAIARQQQQLLDHRAGVIQVSEGFEQRHYAHRPLHARLFKQQLHRQNVRRSAGHGDDIRTQGCRRCGGNFLTGVEHLGRVRRRFEIARQQRSTVGQLLHQEADAHLFVPVLVTAQAKVVGDFGHGGRMTAGILTHIQAHQEQTEGHRTAQAVEQRAIGDHAHAAFMQRLVAQLQRLQQVAVVLQYLGRRRGATAQRGMCPLPCSAQAFAQLLEQGAIRLDAITDLGLQRRAGLLHRQLGGQMIDIAQVQVGGHPARQQ